MTTQHEYLIKVKGSESTRPEDAGVYMYDVYEFQVVESGRTAKEAAEKVLAKYIVSDIISIQFIR